MVGGGRGKNQTNQAGELCRCLGFGSRHRGGTQHPKKALTRAPGLRNLSVCKEKWGAQTVQCSLAQVRTVWLSQIKKHPSQSDLKLIMDVQQQA